MSTIEFPVIFERAQMPFVVCKMNVTATRIFMLGKIMDDRIE